MEIAMTLSTPVHPRFHHGLTSPVTITMRQTTTSTMMMKPSARDPDIWRALAYLMALPGPFEARFYRSGTTARLAGPLPFQLADGAVQTLVLMDSAAAAPELFVVQDAL